MRAVIALNDRTRATVTMADGTCSRLVSVRRDFFEERKLSPLMCDWAVGVLAEMLLNARRRCCWGCGWGRCGWWRCCSWTMWACRT